MAYEAVTARELATKWGPRPGVVAFRDAVLFWTRPKGTYDAGIYNRRPMRGLGNILTPNNASLHAVGRAWDCGTPDARKDPSVGNEIVMHGIGAAGFCGIIEIIFNGNRVTAESGWKCVPYHGEDMHYTHVHFGFSQQFADSTAPHAALVSWCSKAMFGL